LTRPAARLAGQAFRKYRRQGGTKTGVLPDFFIGAHAQADGHQLLTRDAGRYRNYFPDIDLISP
jgi:predicted nucleic acid-binding protein